MTIVLLMILIYYHDLELGQGLLSNGPDFEGSVPKCQRPLFSDPKQRETRYLSHFVKLSLKINSEKLVLCVCVKIIHCP